MSLEAERAVLGAILLDTDQVLPLARVKYHLDAEAFTDVQHRTIYAAILAVAAAGRRPDPVTVLARLVDASKWDGGERPLQDLIDGVPTVAHAEHYLDIVRRAWRLRQIKEMARDIAVAAAGSEADPDHVAGMASERFLAVRINEAKAEASNTDVCKAAAKHWRDVHDRTAKPAGLETPWTWLTMLMGGVEPGITIIAGRPSAGKSTMESALAVHLAKMGVPVARVMRDCSRSAALRRTLAAEAGVSLPKLKFGYARKNQLAAVDAAADGIGALPMFFNDHDGDVKDICAWCRAMVVRNEVKVITVDYAQIVTAGRIYDPVEKVTYVSGMFKSLATELGVPVILLSQLSRGLEQDGKKKQRLPQLSDLRDSGALEQDADKVLFLYRDDKQAAAMEELEPDSTKKLRPVWADLLKHKDGETGRIPMWFRAHYFTFFVSVTADGTRVDDTWSGPLPADRESDGEKAGEPGRAESPVPAEWTLGGGAPWEEVKKI